MKPRSLLHSILLLIFAALLATPHARAQIVNAPPVPEWITATDARTNQALFVRREFSAPATLLKSILLGATDGAAEIWLNGARLGEFSGSAKAATFDLTARIKPATNNILLVRVLNATNLPTVALLLELNADLARQTWLPSDATWSATTAAPSLPPLLSAPGAPPVTSAPTHAPTAWFPARTLAPANANPAANPFDPKRALDAYNSWKLASGSAPATDPATFTTLPGFKVELIRSAQTNEGSWIALAFDPKGRLTLAREKRGLLRLSLDATRVTQVEVINDTLLECRGLLYALGALYANANNTKALVRLRDTQGKDQFDEITELLRTEGGVGHGRNHIKLGPDGWLWIAHGNNVRLPKNISTNSPLRNYAHDRLLPCPWDASMFDGDVTLPAGHILRLKPDGSEVQLWAGGLRNPLDLAFNQQGDLFTFDADMEWDIGTPWYMPNRVLHVVPGADFGWRRGTARWPAWYPDTLPSVVDIGLASPTGVIFGYGAKFPEKYKNALFLCDWAYGRILAVHLNESGSSYTGTNELFIGGRPMNVTDACIGPDGAMWFITGGRGTQSGLYHVSYSQPVQPSTLVNRELNPSQASLGDLKELMESVQPGLVGENRRILGGLKGSFSSDRTLQNVGRTLLESASLTSWVMPKKWDKTNFDGHLTTLLARVRSGDPNSLHFIKTRLFGRFTQSISPEQQITTLRILALTFIRLGPPDETQRQACLHWLEPLYPTTDSRVNQMLVELLVYLRSPQVIPKTLALLRDATTSEDLLHYPFFLRYVQDGWTLDARRAVFAALDRAEKLPGARQYFKALADTRKEHLAALTPADRETILQLSAASSLHNSSLIIHNSNPAPFVKNWKLTDLLPRLADASRGRSWAGARTALTQAQCVLCHRVSADNSLPASVLGPDLTSVASRFSRRDLLEQIIDPSKIIDEKFRNVTLFLADGSDLTGTIESEDAAKLILRPNPLSPDTVTLAKKEIRRRELSNISPMPTDLLNTLTADQILDLLAWFEASGNPTHPAFKP